MSKLVLPNVLKAASTDQPETPPATPPAPTPEPETQPQALEATAPATDELPPPLAEAVESQPIIPKPEPAPQPQPEPAQPAKEATKPSSSKALVSGLLLAGLALVGIIAAMNGKGVNSGPTPANPGGSPAPSGAAGNIPRGLV